MPLQCRISPDIPAGLFDIVRPLTRHPGLVPGSAAQPQLSSVVETQSPAQGRGDDEDDEVLSRGIFVTFRRNTLTV